MSGNSQAKEGMGKENKFHLLCRDTVIVSGAALGAVFPGVWMQMEGKNDHQPFGIEYLWIASFASSVYCSVQYFFLCGLLCLLASIMLLLKKSHLILWLFYAKLVCCLWLFPSILQLEVCFSVSLWCFLCLPCLQATYVVPFYTWRPSKICEREWDQSGCL